MDSVMIIDAETGQTTIKAFVPDTGTNDDNNYFRLINVLQSANIEVLSDEDSIKHADCAIHLIANNKDNVSRKEEYWLKKSGERNIKDNFFRIFIWQPSTLLRKEMTESKLDTFKAFRNSLNQNVVFCNHISPIMFVEDLRTIIYEENHEKLDTRQTDIFFIYNEIDEDKGESIVELLSDILKVEKLNLSLRSETDYSVFISQQIQKSRLTTIYFNRTANWAVPFTQQIWKNIGGASANKSILLAGDNEIETNCSISLELPNVDSLCTSKELIPLEIKVFYDKLFSR